MMIYLILLHFPEIWISSERLIILAYIPVTKLCMFMAVPDPDLEIRGEGGGEGRSSRPFDKRGGGEGGLQKKFFGLSEFSLV